MFDPAAILLGPVITEKSTAGTAKNQYTFWVTKESTKNQIAKAVEIQCKVSVLEVRVINVRGKKVRFGKGRQQGQRQDRRKAMVIIKAGQKIELFETDHK